MDDKDDQDDGEVRLQKLLRQFIFTHYLKHCRPPSLQELTSSMAAAAVGGGGHHLPEEKIWEILRALENGHHIVLYENSGSNSSSNDNNRNKKPVYSPTPIAMAHPFSH